MKLKYYMRGLGMGIVLTTLILTIGKSKETLSDEEIMKRAAELGMVLDEEEDRFDELLTNISPTNSTKAPEVSVTSEPSVSVSPTSDPTITPASSVSEEALETIASTTDEEGTASVTPTVEEEPSATKTPAVKEEDTASKTPTVKKEETATKTPTVKEEDIASKTPTVKEETASETPDVEEEEAAAISPTPKEEGSVEKEAKPSADAKEEKAERQASDQLITFTVKKGMSSDRVAAILEEKGLVKDADDFNRYIIKVGKSKIIRVGTFSLPKNASYEDIVNKLTGK
jgi:hypothetical protein